MICLPANNVFAIIPLKYWEFSKDHTSWNGNILTFNTTVPTSIGARAQVTQSGEFLLLPVGYWVNTADPMAVLLNAASQSN